MRPNKLSLAQQWRLGVWHGPRSKASLDVSGILGKYILHDRPDDGQTTGFRGEGIHLIRSLANMAKEA